MCTAIFKKYAIACTINMLSGSVTREKETTKIIMESKRIDEDVNKTQKTNKPPYRNNYFQLQIKRFVPINHHTQRAYWLNFLISIAIIIMKVFVTFIFHQRFFFFMHRRYIATLCLVKSLVFSSCSWLLAFSAHFTVHKKMYKTTRRHFSTSGTFFCFFHIQPKQSLK